MNTAIKEAIFQKIKEYDRICLFRHVRNDGDCVGATKGFKALLAASFPEKEVYLIDENTAQYLAFMGPEDEPIPAVEYASALGIVLDTASKERISNKNFEICKELIKIDHHIPVDNYGDINWVEEERSSCCEMVVDFYATFKDELTLNTEAATHLYTGMVTDSGRFKYSGVSGETMRCAGVLLDVGIDTETLFARLYLEAFEYLKFKAYIYEKMCVTENGVAYIYVDKEMQEKFSLNQEQASAVVGTLDSIRGCISWMALIDNPDGTIRVRLRSRFVKISDLAEKYHGGGHAQAAGATCYSKEEMENLIRECDALVKEYKENNEGWL